MLALPRAEEPPAAPGGASAPVEALLLDDALWWAPKADREVFPADRLWAALECGSCGARFSRAFRSARSPWTGGGEQPPLYRDLEELFGVLARLAEEREPRDLVAPFDWSAAQRCACGAPSHRTGVLGTALLHSMPGRRALVALRQGEARRAFLLQPEGALEPVDATEAGIEEAFGAPLTLAPVWAELLERLPPPEGEALGALVEPGAFVLAARGREALHAAAEARLEGAPHLVVLVDPSTVRSRAWPARLAPLAERVEEGVAVALVIERAALARRLKAIARARSGADVVEREGGFELRTADYAWPITAESVGLSMVQLGRTLTEACRLMVSMALTAGADRLETLKRMVELVPGSFEVDGTRATGLRPDGTRGRTIDLTDLPARASARPGAELVREAAFLLDAAPEWADRARICPCGAAATLERRLVAWPWTGEPEAAPHVLEVLEGEGAAVVVALACDRHVRLPSAREVERLGLDPERIEVRLRADRPDARGRVLCRAFPRGAARPEVMIVEGAHLGGIVLDAGRLAALHAALGAPFGEGAALAAWALGTDRLALASGEDPAADGRVERLLAAGVAERGLVVRRRHEAGAAPVGRFDVVRERG